jgi:hypothetical protein
MNILQLTEALKSYIALQLDNMAINNPIINFMKPLITRAVDNNIGKATKVLNLIADSEGNIDIENIISEMMQNVLNAQPFTFNTSFIGNIEIGGGHIKLNIPLTDKRLVLGMSDLETFKEMLITKR